MAPEQIVAALQKLDVNNDGHWTQDGLPRLETVRLFAGNQSLTRDDITKAAPDFTRLVAYNAQQAAQSAPAPVAAATQETQPSAQETPPAAPPLADPAPLAAPTPTPVIDAAAADVVQAASPKFDDLSEEEQLEVLQGEIAEMDRYLNAAKKHRAELQTKADDLIIRLDKKTPKHSNQQDIRAYLNSQNKQLQRRAEQIANVRKVESELGAKLSDFAPKRAPIDAAMARKTGYGRNRPGR